MGQTGGRPEVAEHREVAVTDPCLADSSVTARGGPPGGGAIQGLALKMLV